MHEAGNGTVGILAQRVDRFLGRPLELLRRHHHGSAQRMARVGPIQQARVIGRDGVGQAVAIALQCRSLIIRQLQHAFERLESAQRMTQLPAPVVPAVVISVGKERPAEGPRLSADGESRHPNLRTIGRYCGLHLGLVAVSIGQLEHFSEGELT